MADSALSLSCGCVSSATHYWSASKRVKITSNEWVSPNQIYLIGFETVEVSLVAVNCWVDLECVEALIFSREDE